MAKRGQAVRSSVKNKKLKPWHEKLTGVIKLSSLVRGAVVVITLAVLTGLYQKIDQLNVLPIEKVQIEGEFRYLSKQSLRTQALPHVQGGFFTVDLVSVRNAVIELPWVEDVSIRRYWPNELRVRVIEKQAVAYWSDNQLLSSRAELFTPERLDKNMMLPRINGPEGQHRNMLKELAGMQSWLMDAGLSIVKLTQDSRRSWVIHLDSGFELRLGRENYHERLQRFVSVFTQSLYKQHNKIKHVDMRYTNGMAVAWKEA
ncbi:MAG: cell division protein FtsQ/DivIB [Gammaproteobacteria bacterium]|nr:cell division protein FtsQ/DivIB [Gammaproteobacteria bacterium]